MNRWVVPGAVVAGVVAAVVASGAIGPQVIPEVPFAASASRVSVVCPAFRSVTASVRVAVAAAGPGLRTTRVSEPNQGNDAGQFKLVTSAGEPLRVSAPLPEPFGASTVIAAEDGPERGLSAAGCVVPRTDHWFTGVDVREQAQSEVVVANLDGTEASVDLTVYGEAGRVGAPRGVEVPGNSSKTISLGVLPRADGPLTVQVSSSDGRVAAFLRQRTWDGEVPLGVDWIPAAEGPATDLVVPGIPAGGGRRSLVLTNPGERTATVTVGVLSESGPIELSGSEQVEVPAGTTRAVTLTAGLAGQAAALDLTSTRPVTAGMLLDSGGDDSRNDPAFTAGVPALPADSLWPLAVGKGAQSVLQLTNPAQTEVTATVTMSTGSAAAGEPKVIRIGPGSTVTVALAQADANVVRVQTEALDLRGALVSTRRLGKVRGLAVVDLIGQDGRGSSARVVFDPRAGS